MPKDIVFFRMLQLFYYGKDWLIMKFCLTYLEVIAIILANGLLLFTELPEIFVFPLESPILSLLKD